MGLSYLPKLGAWSGKNAYTGFKGGQFAATGSSMAGGIAGGVGTAAAFGQQLLEMRKKKMDEVHKNNPFYAGAGMQTEKDILEIVEIAAALGMIAFGGPTGWVSGGLTLAGKGAKYA